MATATTAKGLNKVEMKLLNDFANTVTAREFTAGVVIDKLTLTYSAETGFEIDLVENAATTEPVPESEVIE